MKKLVIILMFLMFLNISKAEIANQGTLNEFEYFLPTYVEGHLNTDGYYCDAGGDTENFKKDYKKISKGGINDGKLCSTDLITGSCNLGSTLTCYNKDESKKNEILTEGNDDCKKQDSIGGDFCNKFDIFVTLSYNGICKNLCNDGINSCTSDSDCNNFNIEKFFTCEGNNIGTIREMYSCTNIGWKMNCVSKELSFSNGLDDDCDGETDELSDYKTSSTDEIIFDINSALEKITVSAKGVSNSKIVIIAKDGNKYELIEKSLTNFIEDVNLDLTNFGNVQELIIRNIGGKISIDEIKGLDKGGTKFEVLEVDSACEKLNQKFRGTETCYNILGSFEDSEYVKETETITINFDENKFNPDIDYIFKLKNSLKSSFEWNINTDVSGKYGENCYLTKLSSGDSNKLEIGIVEEKGKVCLQDVFLSNNYCYSFEENHDLGVLVTDSSKTLQIKVNEDIRGNKLFYEEYISCGDGYLNPTIGESCLTCPGDVFDRDDFLSKVQFCIWDDDCVPGLKCKNSKFFDRKTCQNSENIEFCKTDPIQESDDIRCLDYGNSVCEELAESQGLNNIDESFSTSCNPGSKGGFILDKQTGCRFEKEAGTITHNLEHTSNKFYEEINAVSTQPAYTIILDGVEELIPGHACIGGDSDSDYCFPKNFNLAQFKKKDDKSVSCPDNNFISLNGASLEGWSNSEDNIGYCCPHGWNFEQVKKKETVGFIDKEGGVISRVSDTVETKCRKSNVGICNLPQKTFNYLKMNEYNNTEGDLPARGREIYQKEIIEEYKDSFFSTTDGFVGLGDIYREVMKTYIGDTMEFGQRDYMLDVEGLWWDGTENDKINNYNSLYRGVYNLAYLCLYERGVSFKGIDNFPDNELGGCPFKGKGVYGNRIAAYYFERGNNLHISEQIKAFDYCKMNILDYSKVSSQKGIWFSEFMKLYENRESALTEFREEDGKKYTYKIIEGREIIFSLFGSGRPEKYEDYDGRDDIPSLFGNKFIFQGNSQRCYLEWKVNC